MKIINNDLLNQISAEAAASSRLRKNYNLHASLEEPVQRLLNALEPETEIPVHRHKHIGETFIILRGSLFVNFYDGNKNRLRQLLLSPTQGEYGITIPAGVWHNIEVLEKGTVIFEVKEGPYAPISSEDVLK